MDEKTWQPLRRFWTSRVRLGLVVIIVAASGIFFIETSALEGARTPVRLIGFGVILASLTALFRDAIAFWIWRPELELSHVHGPDYCDKVLAIADRNGQKISASCFYFRLRVANKGDRRAEKVEILATDLARCAPDGGAPEIIRRYSMNLRWTNLGTPVLDGLSPNMERFCDIGHIIDPAERAKFGHDLPNAAADSTIFGLDLEAQPNHLSHLIEPGHYQLTLHIAAANQKPIRKTLDFTITGRWSDDLKEMLRDGAVFKLT